ncbi:MAG: transcriptional regulator [Actinobacteria bacterium]|nr:transcriptional regulator [Actinomycetota bacterium]
MQGTTAAREQFESARFRSLLNNLKFAISGRENQLLSFDEIKKELELHNQRYLGVKPVRVKDIVGSIDRYKDFDHYFLPKRAHLEHRWAYIYSAYANNINLPAIKLYKVGEIYFVLDGNHRVSVAKRMGVKYIDAEVIEFKTPVPITREMDPKDMILLAEREKFLKITGLKESRPDIRIRLTIPGKYDFLLDQINKYKYRLDEKSSGNDGEKISFKEAALYWYDNVYLPSFETIKKYGIVENFPNRTKSDLYVWIIAHKYHLREKYQCKNIGLEDAAYDFSTRYSEGFWPHIRIFFSKIFKPLKRKKSKFNPDSYNDR